MPVNVHRPDDFDEFWSRILQRVADVPLRPSFEYVPERSTDDVAVYDVHYDSWEGVRISGWYAVPRSEYLPGPYPALMLLPGYISEPVIPRDWAKLGYAAFAVAPRGKLRSNERYDPGYPGLLVDNIIDPNTYGYRGFYVDAVRAVEAVRTLPGVDAARVAVQGGSQGGGITLAVAGLVPDVVAALPDVPFLCHFARALDICDKDPFAEITRYLAVHRARVDDVLHTLSYFDAVNFAKRATAPTLFSVALMDLVCPPSTVYAAYNHYAGGRAGGRDIEVYRYNDHEGGESYQRQAQIRWLNKVLGSP